MLILARRPNQKIIIGKDIEITVLEVKGDVVKIGVSAPRSVQVYRQEVFEAIQEENRRAATATAAASLDQAASALWAKLAQAKLPAPVVGEPKASRTNGDSSDTVPTAPETPPP